MSNEKMMFKKERTTGTGERLAVEARVKVSHFSIIQGMKTDI